MRTYKKYMKENASAEETDEEVIPRPPPPPSKKILKDIFCNLLSEIFWV